MALAETLKLRGRNREVGVPRPCFGAVAPGNRKLMVDPIVKRNKFSLRRPAAGGVAHDRWRSQLQLGAVHLLGVVHVRLPAMIAAANIRVDSALEA